MESRLAPWSYALHIVDSDYRYYASGVFRNEFDYTSITTRILALSSIKDISGIQKREAKLMLVKTMIRVVIDL